MKKNKTHMPDLFSSNDRRKMRDAFYNALKGLTETQLKAVKDIDGPVMVLAGPGTGKTQVFAARYGYILDETDTNINQILCLTYSEAGVLAMRERLLQFIGPAAHEAHIFTYHSFCNKIINENPEYFFDFKKFKLASPLQRYELIEQILLELPDDSRVKRIIGDRYFDIIRFDKQYDNLKKEEKNASQIILQTLEYVDRMAEIPDYQYKKNSAQLKTTYYEDKGKFLRTIDVLKTYTSYLEKMKERQWIDYHDMLLEVKSAFIKHPDLLLKYQEQYLYFLIDEFQDTNAIQNNIVLQLISYWDEPNLFVVGDDDQAIYRFQGANEQNLIQIFKKYPSIDVYCITENFRSTQSILDCANDLIEKLPTGRLKDYYLDLPPGTIEKINKKLISSDAAAGSQPPVIRSFINPQHETLAVFNYIREKHRKKENLADTAILSRRIKTVQDLIYLLELEGIPVSLKLGKDILDQPFIRHFILLLKYLNAEYHELSSGEVYLMPLLYLPYWGLENDDIALIAFLERKNRDRKLLAEKITDKAAWPDAPFKNRESLIQFIEKLKVWQKQLPPVKTLSAIVEEIFRSSGLLSWALTSSESTWNLRCINTLFHQIRSTSQHQPHITLSDYLQQLEKMANFEIAINLEAGYTTSNGVHIL
ncbi:MAG: ATP-dependent helicase, partial [Saprospiraceae bacterium]|nr:ATP-dependent helicase [Saprospiraceae bacterium]